MTKDDIYYQSARPEVAAFLPERFTRVLEIGCGEGRFGVHLKQAAEHWGVEPVPAVAEIARKQLSTVLTGIYDDVEDQLPDGYFDLVVCNDVIEHMTDHDAFLKAIRKKMTPGGVLVGSLPNVRYAPNMFRLLVFKDWHYQSAGVLDVTHFRFFTFKSLTRTFGEHGYAIEELRGINSLIDVRENLFMYLRGLALRLISLLTLGHDHDIRFQQIAFRVRNGERA